MDKKLNVLEALRQSRHDWLNVMQLIKGNLALQRYDRIEEIIEEVTRQSISESKLSTIDAPHLVYFLLTYNWFASEMKLEIDVVGDVFSLKKEEERFVRLCEQITEKLTNGSSMDTENHLLLTFFFKEEKCEITFDYHGTLQFQKEEWDEILDESNVELVQMDKHECVITVSLPRT